MGYLHFWVGVLFSFNLIILIPRVIFEQGLKDISGVLGTFKGDKVVFVGLISLAHSSRSVVKSVNGSVINEGAHRNMKEIKVLRN